MADLEVFLEEPSCEALLRTLLPQILPPRIEVGFRVFNGKADLLRKLPNRLRGYTYSVSRPKILIVLDRDDDDCLDLKRRVEESATRSGLLPRSAAPDGSRHDVCVRIAVEEMEAWLLGDEEALRTAFPRVRPFSGKEKFRDPDDVRGGTWEALEKLLQDRGYYPSGLSKINCASEAARHMSPGSNRSDSFRCLVTGVRSPVP